MLSKHDTRSAVGFGVGAAAVLLVLVLSFSTFESSALRVADQGAVALASLVFGTLVSVFVVTGRAADRLSYGGMHAVAYWLGGSVAVLLFFFGYVAGSAMATNLFVAATAGLIVAISILAMVVCAAMVRRWRNGRSFRSS